MIRKDQKNEAQGCYSIGIDALLMYTLRLTNMKVEFTPCLIMFVKESSLRRNQFITSKVSESKGIVYIVRMVLYLSHHWLLFKFMCCPPAFEQQWSQSTRELENPQNLETKQQNVQLIAIIFLGRSRSGYCLTCVGSSLCNGGPPSF